MFPTPFDRLTRRQAECLRGLAALKSAKAIGRDLGGLAESTVYGHLDAAVRTLGVDSRAEAALLFRDHEAAAARKPPGQSPRVDAAPDPPPSPEPPAVPWRRWLPLRPAGATTNRMPVVARLSWIPVGAILLAIGFGAIVNGLEVLTRVYERLRHLSP